MFSRYRRKVRLLFGLSDVLLAAAAFELAYRTRAALPLDRLFFLEAPTKALLLIAVAVLWPLMGTWLRVYERLDTERRWLVLRDTFRQCVVGGVGLVMVEYLLRLDLSRPFLALFLVYTGLLLCLFRWTAPHLMGWFRRGFGEPHYVLVAGTGERARKLGEALERSADHGIRLMGFLAADNGEAPASIELGESHVVHPLEQLPKLLENRVIDEIIFAVDSKRLAELEDVLLLCDEDGVRTRVAVDFFPHVNSEIYFDRLQHTPLLTFSAAPHDEIRLLVKRLLDVTSAAIALLVLAPVMLCIILLIRLTSTGAAIFRQQRCGLNGRRFVFYKFRSMVAGAEAMKKDFEHLNQKETAFKIADDPRITPIGRWLRKFSIDEWPQLWNVLKGDMSLVGPRPPVPEEVENYARWQRRRLRMRPGLTCLWAIEGRDGLDFETWMR
ncbi:MAG: exopolysaccharide biosynthesis polyprenyl glycosylphosphotransferase, partial [bacterium]|nr:exopolysaccharide biosynthesis polyprenyl glycosylphosphotransferase [bacterium]